MGKQIEIAVYLYNKQGAEGQTAHSENGISRTYESADVPGVHVKRDSPFRGWYQMRTLKRNQREIYYATLIKGNLSRTNGAMRLGNTIWFTATPHLSESTFRRRPGEVGNQTVRTDGKLRQDVNYRRYGLSD